MAGKQVAGDGLSANLAGMSKSQLYDIMSQMKTLIEQNQQQAKQILIQNPVLTRTLFQAQIMLGMVQPPQAVPISQPAASQNLQPSRLPTPQSNIQATPSSQGQGAVQDQPRKQQQSQPVMPVSSASVPPPNFPSETLPSHSLQSLQQPKVHGPPQSAPAALPQSLQVPNMTPLPHHSAPQQPSHLQPPMPPASTQLQQPMQTSGIQHLPLQPPLPPQGRPQMPGFPHQLQSQPNVGFQLPGAPQFHYSQPMFHPGTKPPVNAGPPFMQGQPPLPSHLPPQSLYQVGGSHMGTEFNQGGSSVQADKASAYTPGLPENRTGAQLPGPPPFAGQMGPSNQPPGPPSLTPDMEKALLEKVMSLTPEQIHMLPPDQRNQVLQLQQILRQ